MQTALITGVSGGIGKAIAKKFIDENTSWDDIHQYIADVLLKLGIKPYKNIRMFF